MTLSTSLSERVFFGLAGLWFVVLAVVGFWESFYFRTSLDLLPTHMTVHGIVYSAWVLLFIIQALLISAQRTRWHMTLGVAAVFLLLLMIPVGFHVVLAKAAVGDKSIAEAGFNLTELTWASSWRVSVLPAAGGP